MTYTVYMHICMVNLKVYIGITSQIPERRWKNGYGYDECPLFWKAIKKYGWDNFAHLIIAHGLEKEEASRMEIDLISRFHSNDERFGYNLAEGGSINRGYKLSEETRAKIREKRKYQVNPMLGKHLSEESKRKISEAKRGSHPKREPHSEETKRKISESHKGKMMGASNPIARSVLQYTKDGEFVKEWDCICDAGRSLGISPSNITTACKGKIKSSGGYIWKYKD